MNARPSTAGVAAVATHSMSVHGLDLFKVEEEEGGSEEEPPRIRVSSPRSPTPGVVVDGTKTKQKPKRGGFMQIVSLGCCSTSVYE